MNHESVNYKGCGTQFTANCTKSNAEKNAGLLILYMLFTHSKLLLGVFIFERGSCYQNEW